MKNIILFLLPFLLLVTLNTNAQKNVVDKIVAIVGEEVILKSDIEGRFLQDQAENHISTSADYKASILEDLLIQKLLLAQAKIDSIEVTDSEVEEMVDERMNYYQDMLGSPERVETFFGKTTEDIRNELRTLSSERMIAERMQREVVKKIRTTPSEVRSFYKKINKDSLPDIPDKFEIQQIVIKPVVSDMEKERIRTRLREFREQIMEGKSTFNTLAVLYSEDPASAVRGGELGYKSKHEVVPEFAEVAFSLKPGRVSRIVETEYGFHIMQLIDRKGEKVNVRHILLKPKVYEKESEEAIEKLDSIRSFILDEKMTFEEAAYYFSTDKQTKNNGGLLAGSGIDAKVERGEIKGDMARQINSMKVGEISQPFIDRTEIGEEFKIIKLKAFYPQHVANLDEDWFIFENLLGDTKREETLLKWVREKQADTYISIDEEYRNAKFKFSGWVK